MQEDEIKKTAEQFISTGDFNAELDNVIEGIENDIKTDSKIQDLQPFIHSLDTEGKLIYMVLMDFNSNPTTEKRGKYLSDLGRQIAKEEVHITCAFLTSMVFTCSLSPKERQEKYGTKMIQDIPEGIEGIAVTGMTIDKRTNFASANIIRNWNKKYIRELKEWRKIYYQKVYNPDEGAVASYLLECFFKAYLTGVASKFMNNS